MITNDEAKRIVAALPRLHRDIFRFCCETGVRISDALALPAYAVGKITYIPEKKTGKMKIATLSDELLADLANKKFDYFLIDGRMVPILNRSKLLFPGRRSDERPLHRSTYHRALKRASAATGIAFSAHSTRKLYAWNVFEATKDIFEVQKALNHKYVTTTADYLGVDLRGLVNRALV